MSINFFDGAKKNVNWIGGFFILLGLFGLCFKTLERMCDGAFDEGILAFVYVLFSPFGILKTIMFFISLGVIVILIKNVRIFKKQ